MQAKIILSVLISFFLLSGNVLAQQRLGDYDDLIDRKMSDDDYQEVSNFEGEYTELFEKPSVDSTTTKSMIDLFNAQSATPYAQMGLLHVCSSTDLILQFEGRTSPLALSAVHQFALAESGTDDVLEIQNTLTGVQLIFHRMACYSGCAEDDETCLAGCQLLVSLTASSMQARAPYAIVQSQTQVCQSTDQRSGAIFIGQLPGEIKFKTAVLSAQNQDSAEVDGPDDAVSLSELADCMGGQQHRDSAQIRQGPGSPPNVGNNSPNSATIDLKCLNDLVNPKINPSSAITPGSGTNSADGGGGCALRVRHNP